MALTKIGSIGINTGISFAGVTTIATLNASDNVLSVGGTVNFVSDVSIGGTVSIAGTLTYEDVTNVDAVGLITARDGIKVGSGITLSVDGDIFATGVVTATSFVGSGSGLTGVASTDDIRTNTNATFLQNVSLGDVTARQKLHISASDSGAANMVFTNTTTGTAAADGFIVGLTGGEDAQLNMQESANLKFSTADTERLRIGSAGQLGIGGANYGTSGQVLTSQGSGSAVQWATPAVTGGNMFIAKMNSGYNTSNNTDGEIVFQNEVFDSDGRYNNSNGRFTPNVAGYYFIDASLQFSTNSANNNFESTIWKNGSEQFVNRMWNDGSNSDVHCKVTGIVSVNGSSDYISIAAWQNSGGNITINPGNGSYFMGYFLRPL